MLKDLLAFAFVFVLGFIASLAYVASVHIPVQVPIPTNGRYIGVLETGDDTAEALVFSSKEACEAAGSKLRAIVKDPANADAVAKAGGKVWLMPCTPVVSELITK